MARLSWPGGWLYIEMNTCPRMATHSSTNGAQHRATSVHKNVSLDKSPPKVTSFECDVQCLLGWNVTRLWWFVYYLWHTYKSAKKPRRVISHAHNSLCAIMRVRRWLLCLYGIVNYRQASISGQSSENNSDWLRPGSIAIESKHSWLLSATAYSEHLLHI